MATITPITARIDIMPAGEISATLRPAYAEFVRRVRIDEGA